MGVRKGVQFENLVVNHVAELIPHLHVPMGMVRSAAPFLLKGRNRTRGVQIDLLIQTDRTAWIVEVKRRTRIGREIEKELSDKVAAFPKRRGISVRTALVYSGVLDEAVSRSGSFDAIVPFSSILGLSGQ